jgi:flagellar secretion chaperone FliS
MNIYQQRTLEGASGVDLTVALYDGIVRFMRQAISAVERSDAAGRRVAVKRAMDILMHLQATLRMGTEEQDQLARTLAEFYASMFALMLQGSTAASKEKFEQVICQVLNVRGAWQQVAAGVAVEESHPSQAMSKSQPPISKGFLSQAVLDSASQSSSWTA